MRAEDRREQILDVVREIVAAEGFHAASPKRVADDAGITRPVLYQQFGDMAGLFVALIDREAGRAAAQFLEVVVAFDDAAPADAFWRIFDAVIAGVDAAPATWRLFLLPPEGAPPALHQRLADSDEQVRAYLREMLRAHFPHVEDPDYTALVMHAAGRELLRQRVLDPEDATRQRLTALVTRLVAAMGPR